MTARSAVLLAGVPLAAIAQSATPHVVVPQITTSNTQWFSTAVVSVPFQTASGHSFQPVIGHPYSAEQATERAQTLADGTHITQKSERTLLYRDSEGRTRTEHIVKPPPGAAASFRPPTFIQIADPVAGYRYFLEPSNHIARRSPWGPVRQTIATLPMPVQNSQHVNQVAPANRRPPTAPDGRPHPDVVRESIGVQTIEGVLAEGMRITATYPEGFFGNDRPITTVNETWMSPDLRMVVLYKNSDPRTGDTTTQLTNVSLNEPDPSLFQIPADYTIADQSN